LGADAAEKDCSLIWSACELICGKGVPFLSGKQQCMKHVYPLLFAFGLTATPLCAFAGGISSITQSPQSFNGEQITVRGSVANFHQTVNSMGKSYATFSVCADACVRVFAIGIPRISNGQNVTVTGMFSMVDHIGSMVYYNQIDANELSIRSSSPMQGPASR